MESPGVCVVKVPRSAASAVAGGSYHPAYKLWKAHGPPEQSSWEKDLSCLWQMPLFMEECDGGTCCWHQAALPVPGCWQSPLLPLVPLGWVVHVSKIHRWCKSLEVLFTSPWCVEAEFRRCRKLPVSGWDWDPGPFPGMGKGRPSLSFFLSSKTKNWAYSFWGSFWSSHWDSQASCIWHCKLGKGGIF